MAKTRQQRSETCRFRQLIFKRRGKEVFNWQTGITGRSLGPRTFQIPFIQRTSPAILRSPSPRTNTEQTI